ncbi:hypothetical protein NQ176_g5426 [Zarea fungicola]|uniref:Uncharacterized protein n=1 Tax=Zarea fungicola TaxID=93591 RepID=A0ACC1NAF4_9HYPO|nr:hypothetical protein NQ176_g5426 [Lecanicillium fungicola]
MVELKTVYVITGANRGIGLCMVQLLLSRPQTVVVGTVRSEDTRAQLLSGTASVVLGAGSKLVSVLIDYSAHPEASEVENLVSAALLEASVKHVDVLVANAGYTNKTGSVLETTPAEMRELYEVNTIGPLVMFQGLCGLLTQGRYEQGRDGVGKYVLISSSIGSIGMMEPMPGGAYGPSKAAANWITKAVHMQFGDGIGAAGEGKKNRVVGVSVHPGWVKTSMGEVVAQSWGVPEGHGPNLSAEESARNVVDLVDRAEELGGKFVMEGGKELLW